jgi:hypothetical protein
MDNDHPQDDCSKLTNDLAKDIESERKEIEGRQFRHGLMNNRPLAKV